MPYDYNERLAQRRADSAVDYLRKRWNLGPNRIIAKGYGETQLVNNCKNGVKCNEEEHQKNRRTEFKVISQ
jgi:outer membrane protein OmpA-like peptidoglycan-associated protein